MHARTRAGVRTEISTRSRLNTPDVLYSCVHCTGTLPSCPTPKECRNSYRTVTVSGVERVYEYGTIRTVLFE